jgi:hypothetical protein
VRFGCHIVLDFNVALVALTFLLNMVIMISELTLKFLVFALSGVGLCEAIWNWM